MGECVTRECDDCPNGSGCVCVSPVWSQCEDCERDADGVQRVYIAATMTGKGGLV